MESSGQTSTKKRKALMLQALEQTMGIVTPACKSAKVGSSTYYNWLEIDPEFKKAVDKMPDIALDFAESKLHELIKDKHPTAIIFYLKTKGKHRGYIEKSEIEHSGRTVSVTFDESE